MVSEMIEASGIAESPHKQDKVYALQQHSHKESADDPAADTAVTGQERRA